MSWIAEKRVISSEGATEFAVRCSCGYTETVTVTPLEMLMNSPWQQAMLVDARASGCERCQSFPARERD
jgi:hypothetical protein